jgi:hypothetical protein
VKPNCGIIYQEEKTLADNYERFHVAAQTIENESSGERGLGVSVFVDSLGKVTIHLGKSMTIRTDDQGLQSLRHMLHDASVSLDHVVGHAIHGIDAEVNS